MMNIHHTRPLIGPPQCPQLRPTWSPARAPAQRYGPASRLLTRAYDSALQGVGLNVTQLATLRSIERISGKPLSQVADALSLDRTSVYRSVSTMERQDWVSVHDGPDGRSRSVTVEEPGRELLERASQP